ncbi:MAG: transglutaminase-like cysteine peptidase, partial [Gammaproteobacteria bacterium]|nr:transglutaminase-like cysteine peptidase [Gammaproteobacteria bacterium]
MASQFRAAAAKRLFCQTLLSCVLATAPALTVAESFPPDLFGYSQTPRADIAVFPQWVQALERHLTDDLKDGSCVERRFNRCHLREWRIFLSEIKGLSRPEQIRRVNLYANNKDYVLDLDNYGVIDYWAVPREFLFNGGDCEDYAITKMMSLRWLGHASEDMRIVVLQDTNLRIAHAVMAIGSGGDILILDNQADEVLSHKKIVHYAPVYS